MTLANKTALITGGGTGIGAGCGESRWPARAARSPSPVAEPTSWRGDQAFDGTTAIKTHLVDVTDRASVAELFRWADKELGRVDILVNCAGVNTVKRSIHDLVPEEWDRIMAINATGAYNCIREVLPGLESPQGRPFSLTWRAPMRRSFTVPSRSARRCGPSRTRSSWRG